jgi:hypothetical protein
MLLQNKHQLRLTLAHDVFMCRGMPPKSSLRRPVSSSKRSIPKPKRSVEPDSEDDSLYEEQNQLVTHIAKAMQEPQAVKKDVSRLPQPKTLPTHSDDRYYNRPPSPRMLQQARQLAQSIRTPAELHIAAPLSSSASVPLNVMKEYKQSTTISPKVQKEYANHQHPTVAQKQSNLTENKKRQTEIAAQIQGLKQQVSDIRREKDQKIHNIWLEAEQNIAAIQTSEALAATVTRPDIKSHCRFIPDAEMEIYANQFRQHGNVVVHNFLNTPFAEALLRYLQNVPTTQWHLSAVGKSISNPATDELEKKFTLSVNDTLIPEASSTSTNAAIHKILLHKRWEEAGNAINGDKIAYRFYRTAPHGSQCSCMVCTCERLLVTDDVLQHIEFLTGQGEEEPALTKTSAVFASRFTKGCFLGTHSDVGRGKYGFILNLTKNWRPNFGGMLHLLYDDWSTVKTVISPTFNSLVLYAIPEKGMPQFVSHVAEHLTASHYTISGWFA